MSDKMREEFEEWATKHHGVYSIGKVDGYYSNQNVQNDWFVWQASRAALVVELPDAHCIDGYFYVDLAEIEFALEKAGVKYK